MAQSHSGRGKAGPFSFLGRSFYHFLAATGFFALVLVGVLLYSLNNLLKPEPPPDIPDKAILTWVVKEPLSETRAGDFLTYLEGGPSPFAGDVLVALEHAAADPRIQGLAVRVAPGAGFSLAQTEELRGAIAHFRKADKETYFFSDNFGGGSNATGLYYLAAAFDEIWMPPMSTLNIFGLHLEQPFISAALEKLDITAQFFQREAYKGAAEIFERDSLSPESRAQLNRLLSDIHQRMVEAMAAGREMEPETVQDLIDRAPLTDAEARATGLVDQLGTRQQAWKSIKELFPQDSRGVELGDYMKHIVGARRGAMKRILDNLRKTEDNPLPELLEDHPLVAMVGVSGPIVSRTEGDFGRQGMADADAIAKALYEVAGNELYEGVILRIDSPGGSVEASEKIYQAVQAVKARDIPVIVSMAGRAASGGYWIAAPADKIIVAPSTLTGSIGVVSGKFALKDFWARFGVNWDGLQRGENAEMYSLNQPFDAKAKERINALMDHTYQAFLRRVAEGRDLSAEELEALAGGRVWTGAQAVQNGLADHEGGYMRALNEMAQALEIESYRDFQIHYLPQPRRSLARALRALRSEGRMPAYILRRMFAEISGADPADVQADFLRVRAPLWMESAAP